MRLVDADALIEFPYSPESGTNDMIEDWIMEAGLCGESVGFDEGIEEKARKLCELVIKGFINVVNTEPTAYDLEKVSNGWIPCEKEMPPQPEENTAFDNRPVELYLVSEEDADYPFRAFWNGKCFTDGFGKVEVVAWMPLPKPYREDKEDERNQTSQIINQRTQADIRHV